MNREIKFRGKRNDNGEWVYGDYLYNPFFKRAQIFWTDNERSYVGEVIRETVGQFTGLKDKNGKDIFEGDIIQYTQHGGYNLDSFTSKVVWDDTRATFGYVYKFALGEFVSPFSEHDELEHDFLPFTEVTGNIYEQ